MRHWWLAAITVVVLFSQVTPLRAAWFRNLAVRELQTPWLAQRAQLFDPPCQASGSFPEIEHYLRLSLVQAPPDERVLTHLGRVRWLAGDCDEAVAMWKQASLDHDPAAAFELFRAGVYNAFPGDVRLALADYAYARANDPSLRLDAQAANTWFRRAFEIAPQHRSANYLARWYEQAGSAAEVLALWQKMADRLPSTDAEYWWAQGRMHALNNEWEAAALAYEKGGGLASAPYEYWIEAGSAWEQAKDLERAAAIYERARQAQPQFVSSYLGLGNVRRLQKQYPEALKYYTQTLEVAPEYAHCYYYLGLTHYLMSDNTRAQRELQKALELDPDHISAMYYLAQILYDAGNLSLAESWLEDVIDHVQKAPFSLWEQLGDWRLEQHHCSESRTAYERARAAGASEPVIEQKLKVLSDVCYQ